MLRVACFLLAKYYAFFIVLAFIGDRFKSSVVDNSDGVNDAIKNTTAYFLYISFAVVLFTLILIGPFYGALRIRPVGIRVLSVGVLFAVEYATYTWLASTTDLVLGIYNGLATFVFLVLFFPPRLNAGVANGEPIPDYKDA